MIGSNFPLEPKSLFQKTSLCINRIDPKSVVWLQSCRSAFSLLIKLLNISQNDQVLIPAYHCEEITKPFLLRGIPIYFYPIEKDLQINLSKLKSKTNSQTKLIIYINYLGWPQKEARGLQLFCQQKKISLLEDNVPVTPQKIKAQNNLFRLYSFRKHAGIPSGGLLIFPKNLSVKDFSQIVISQNKKTVDILKMGALIFRFFHQILPWETLRLISYKLHRTGENLLDDTPRQISFFSRFLVTHYNWQNCAQKRRTNAEYLLKKIKPLSYITSLVNDVPPDAAPLFFPIIANRARELKEFLLSQGIFTEVDWKWPEYLEKNNFLEAWWLTNNTVYLTIDQRYGKKEIDYQVNKIKEFFQKL